MAPEAIAVYRFVGFLTKAWMRLLDFASTLRMRTEVAQVSSSAYFSQVRRSPPPIGSDTDAPPTLEFCVAAELRNNQALDWAVEVYFNGEGFVIESYVQLSRDRDESDMVADFGTRRSPSLDEFESQLNMAVSELIESTHLIHRAVTESGYWWERPPESPE